MNQPIKRRTFLKGVAGTAAASTLGFPYISARGADTLVINSYGAAFEKFMRSEIIPPFEEKTGIKTTLDIGLGKGWLANLRAAGPDNPPYDVLMTNETWASIERGEGYFEQIPEGAVPNMENVWPIARLADNWGVIGTLSPLGLTYRNDLVDPPPEAWEDLWTRKEFRGRTGMYTITNSAGYMFVLMTARTFFGSEYEVDKAIDKIKELRPFHQVDSGATTETMLDRGEVIVAPLDFATTARLKVKGSKLDIAAPREGMFMWEQVFNVLKGSKKKELGYQWIDYILEPETQQKWVENFYWSPVNKHVEVTGELAELVPIHGEKMNQVVLYDWKAANQNRDHVIERWNKEMR